MKKRFMRLVVMLIILATSFSIVGCSSKKNDAQTEGAVNENENAPEVRDKINIAVDSDVGNMNVFGSGNTYAYISNQIYEGLFALGYDKEVVPRLAESWEEIDSTHYIFKIRKGVKFHDGNDLTANDVLFSYKLMQEDANYNQYVINVDFEKTKVVDDYTFELYFKEQNAYTFTNLSNVNIVSEASWTASPDKMVTTPIGTGPYKLKDYLSGSYITLESFSEYWGGEPSIKEATFTVIAEPSQKTTALETGEVQLVMNVQISDIGYLMTNSDYNVTLDTGVQSLSFFLNMNENSVFSNKQVRQAFGYALDNDAINIVAYDGYGKAGTAPFSAAMKDYSEKMVGEIYTTTDVGKAKKMVDESGVDGGVVKIATNGTSAQIAAAEIIQNVLSELGFTAEINNYDSATIWNVGSDPTQWDVLLMVTASPSGYGVDSMKAFLGGLNWSGWKGESFDRFMQLCKETIGANSVDASNEKAVDVVKVIEEEMPIYSLVQLANSYAFDPSLNFRVWNASSLYLKDLKFE
ncbi:ABC transporter substrate-binding protein [Fusibacter ferrireducens]|uniref:ABC transporter substrate-binding protein n=1 Tax=Fusibacter ferrireducens TaxID=2785058 RepID=A0ABR9ZVI9_9FIRM|nr:ABC transporter substrate-binding protein [Fusibacter ferrireducens]MBF4694448.1 ABC transporter substrate-binding protein [Fusibacter ferrireducens]